MKPATFFCVGLTLVFIATRLFGAISWAWYWLISPLWIPWAVLFAIILPVWTVMGFLIWLSQYKKEREKQKLFAMIKKGKI